MSRDSRDIRSALPAGHRRHAPAVEMFGGVPGIPFERPERLDSVRDALAGAGFPPPEAVQAFDHALLERVHDRGYLAFLRDCWSEWRAAGFEGNAMANVWAARRHRQLVPRHVEGKLGYYAFACETSITEGTWDAALESAGAALRAQDWVAQGAEAALALCRPPGHHAGRDFFGGYCFINNAALCASRFLEQGASRVAILDVDFHHGNGTQDIFYERNDVMYVSLHGDPADAFPYFMGYADETGVGPGEGFNLNLPMDRGTRWDRYGRELDTACSVIARFAPDVVVVSLGLDAFSGDPICFFDLTTDDFRRIGECVRRLARPTLFVLEGGYDIPHLGTNLVATLEGFLDG